MGLFDFLKRHKGEHKETRDGITYWAPNPIPNEEYQAKRQAEVDSIEKKYDLSTINGINSIPVPKRKERSSGGIQSVTGRTEYYLFRKASEYEKAGEDELALACYRKANQLMPYSPVSYQKDYYLRLPRYLRRLRRFDEARAEEDKINAMDPSDGVFELSKPQFVSDMISAGHTKKHAQGLYAEYKAERDAEHQKVLFHADYDWIFEFLPDLCPKSFSGYMRMKNANTKNYQKIVAEAKKLGRDIK